MKKYIDYYSVQHPEAANEESQKYIEELVSNFSESSGLSREEVLEELKKGRQIHTIQINPLEMTTGLDWSLENFLHEIDFHLIKFIEGEIRTEEHQDHKEAFMYELLSDENKKIVDTGGSPPSEELPRESKGYKLYELIKSRIKENGYKKDLSDEKTKERIEMARKLKKGN